MIPKTNKNASNKRLGAIKIGLFLILGLFLPIIVKASVFDFTDNFDSYDLGDFYNNDNWTISATGTLYIINANPSPKSFPNLLSFSTTSSNKERAMDKVISGYQPTGVFSFYNKSWYSGDGAYQLIGFDEYNNGCFYLIGSYCTIGAYNYFCWWLDTFGYIASSSLPTSWEKFSIEWNETGGLHQIRYKKNEENWSDWHNYGSCIGIKRINITDSSIIYSQTARYFFDSFLSGTAYGICGTNLDCIFCTNQTACENNGCFWIEGNYLEYGFLTQCVPTEIPIQEELEEAFEPLNYYASNSEYGTPTGVYISLTNITYGLFSYVSSWISHFSNLFDLTEATQKGIEYGQSIPKIRGYLMLFNNIFGNIPIAEVFIFYLIVLIGIIIFRIVRHIKSLLPFQ